MSAQTPAQAKIHDLLVEADAIVKLCAYSNPFPDDQEYAVQGCALSAASRLLTEAMACVESQT